jgi:hypothetical protein
MLTKETKMAYILGGSSGESNGFEKAIANFAIMAVHESAGLVNLTNVVTPTQGNTFEIPIFAPITYQDYTPSGTGGSTGFGDANEQNPSISQNSVTASPAVAMTAFDVFYGWTTSFSLASSLGQELGGSFAEKVDQRVAAGFLSFKATVSNTYYTPTPADGFARATALGAMELRESGATGGTATSGFTATSVLELIRNVKQNWKANRLPGNPVIVLDVQSTQSRLLGELTGGAISQSGGSNLSDLGNELLATGKIESMYGCQIMFSTFLPTASRTVAGVAAQTCKVGAYFGDNAVYTVMKEGLEIKMGEKPGGLQQWMTGLGYFGSGVGDLRRGGAINIKS